MQAIKETMNNDQKQMIKSIEDAIVIANQKIPSVFSLQISFDKEITINIDTNIHDINQICILNCIDEYKELSKNLQEISKKYNIIYTIKFKKILYLPMLIIMHPKQIKVDISETRGILTSEKLRYYSYKSQKFQNVEYQNMPLLKEYKCNNSLTLEDIVDFCIEDCESYTIKFNNYKEFAIGFDVTLSEIPSLMYEFLNRHTNGGDIFSTEDEFEELKYSDNETDTSDQEDNKSTNNQIDKQMNKESYSEFSHEDEFENLYEEDMIIQDSPIQSFNGFNIEIINPELTKLKETRSNDETLSANEIEEDVFEELTPEDEFFDCIEDDSKKSDINIESNLNPIEPKQQGFFSNITNAIKSWFR